MSGKKLKVAVVGLGFGAEFVPIYMHHPAVADVVIADTDKQRLRYVGDKFSLNHRCEFLDDVLRDNTIDAVHLVTGIPQHAEQSIAVLKSGKHCACTVPASTSLDDLHRIVQAEKDYGRNYMMMETAVYTRQFLFVKELMTAGKMGQIQFLKGAHYQDMENWPDYWMGLPPMHYATHAIAPLLCLSEKRASEVHCYGSGLMREELTTNYSNPYPIETAIFRLFESSISAEVSRSLFHTAKTYVESFSVFCEKMSFEWGRDESEPPCIHKIIFKENAAAEVVMEAAEIPDYAHLLPDEIATFTKHFVYDKSQAHLSFEQGGGHHGSHPHLVHEFISSILEGRKSAIDSITAANWTAPGICAHESAMRGGEKVIVPSFD